METATNKNREQHQVEVYTHSKTILADLHTPVSTYLKVRDLFPESALLESSDFHSNENSFSFIGIDPVSRFKVDKGLITKQFPDGTIIETSINDQCSVADELNGFIRSFDLKENNNPTGINGLFGYSSYDAVNYFEDVDTKKQPTAASSIPEMLYILYRFTIVINHFKNELTIVENRLKDQPEGIEMIEALLENRNFASYNFSTRGKETSTITDNEYREMVDEGIKHCKRGDVFQIVLSRRFAQEFTGDDFKVYRALRSINPSPYLFHFNFGSFRIFGSSPETHCKISKGEAYIDPIAGTFKRTGDDEKDKQLAQQLLDDPKENAEHVMLVDLARNDLSKNTNHVSLEFYKEIQYYSHVIHLVSRVIGAVPENSNNFKVFFDTFPAGTLSGAPKVKAMQLIRDIEKHDRGAYGGCIGYIGLDGEINQAITIRSFVSKNNVLYYQAGAGVVSQSNSQSELEEVNNKLGALKRAIDTAEKLIN